MLSEDNKTDMQLAQAGELLIGGVRPTNVLKST